MRSSGKHWDRARQSIGRALALEPRNALAHFTLGRAFHLSAQPEPAVRSYRRAVELRPDFALAHCNLAIVLLDLGEHQQALASGARAVELDPNLGEAHMTVGRALLEQQRFAPAEAALRRALALDPGLVQAYDALGRVCSRFNRSEEALALHRAALALDPQHPPAWYGIGIAHRALGHFDDAIASFRRALAIAPDFAAAHRDLALCQKAAPNEAEVTRMRAILANRSAAVQERAAAAFGLGKFFDDIGDYEEAFRRYAEANSLCREKAEANGLVFQADALRREVDEAIATFTLEFFAARRGWGEPSDLPVFVVGLYRSGTTLTEQILASHRRIFGAGELPDIRRINQRLSHLPRDALKWNAADIATLAHEHLAHLRGLGGAAIRVVDKHPDNVFFLGLIATLFPDAKIICCHRDPRDNVLSCFFQRFIEVMTFSTDIADCARRWQETERIAAHWRRVLPMAIFDLQYETLVADFENQTRRLIDFLGLEWDPACPRFFRTERAVNTPSTWQVRQPIYDSSAGRWRNYERHLEPLLAVLDTGQLN